MVWIRQVVLPSAADDEDRLALLHLLLARRLPLLPDLLLQHDLARAVVRSDGAGELQLRWLPCLAVSFLAFRPRSRSAATATVDEVVVSTPPLTSRAW